MKKYHTGKAKSNPKQRLRKIPTPLKALHDKSLTHRSSCTLRLERVHRDAYVERLAQNTRRIARLSLCVSSGRSSEVFSKWHLRRIRIP